jgi:hypothetical protein
MISAGAMVAAIEPRLQVTTMKKKRCMCMIEPDQLDRMRSVKVTSGLSVPDQIRLGIQFWLASREWPARRRRSRLTELSTREGEQLAARP